MPHVRGHAVLRCIDIALAGTVLLLSAPLIAVIAAAIVIESGGPVFFSQVRLGRGGRHFWMHKFRKFYDGPRAAGAPLTMENDSRLTRVGAVLERTKLDELPQLWNILTGQMAITGPRPESLAFEDCFAGPHREVLDHVPGIFGPSQVTFRNEAALYRGRSDPERFYRDTLFPLKAQIDLAYFRRRTLLGDIYWMIRGALAVFGFISEHARAVDLVAAVESQLRRGGAARKVPAGVNLLAGGAHGFTRGEAVAGASRVGAKRSPLLVSGDYDGAAAAETATPAVYGHQQAGGHRVF